MSLNKEQSRDTQSQPVPPMEHPLLREKVLPLTAELGFPVTLEPAFPSFAYRGYFGSFA